MRVLAIRPLPVGWLLSVPGMEDLVFRSGAEAEATGRDLAMRLAGVGEPVKLVVQLRDGSVGGRFLFPPTRQPGVGATRNAA